MVGITSAVIGGIGSVASAAIGSSAASKAAQASENAANQSAAVQREQLAAAKQALSPYQQAGIPATSAINALLGLGGTTTPATPGTVDWGAYVNGNSDALQNWNSIKNTRDGARFGGDINAFGQFHYGADGSRRDLTPFTSGGTAASSIDGSAAAKAAFDQYRNSTGYDFRVNQGLNAVNSGYAGRGSIKSGAAMKAVNDYGQGMASQEFGNYLNALGNQQSLGMSAGSALAGVGQNYANSLGNIYTQNGANQANAALVKANALGSGINGLANLGGSILGGSSFGQGSNSLAYNPAVINAPMATANSLYSGQTGNWQTWG